jgi:hypothetical protein
LDITLSAVGHSPQGLPFQLVPFQFANIHLHIELIQNFQGASFGGIIWPIMLNLMARRTSFANGVRATAALVAILLLLSNFIMKTRLPPKRERDPLPAPDLKAIFTDWAYLVSMGGSVASISLDSIITAHFALTSVSSFRASSFFRVLVS